MPATILASLRRRLAQLIWQQEAEDRRPGTDHEQEASSDRLLEEATQLHRLLHDHADDIDARLADLRREVILAYLARLRKKDDRS